MRRTGLAARAALAMAVVVTVALVLSGVVALSLIRGAAQRQALDTLDRQAEVVSGAMVTPGQLVTPGRLPTKLRLGRQQIRLLTLTAGGVPHGAVAAKAALSAADVSALLGGADLQGVRRLRGSRLLVAGVPNPLGGAVVLLQPSSVISGVTADAGRRILAALLVGLVGATIAGFLLSRRLARPLQQAAAAAHDLAGGRRDVRLEPVGPTEVAEVADALNTLAAALTTSEGRQREFLLSVSHELRTPLTAVRGFAEALADGVVAPADVPATGATVLAESTRLQRLVTDLLDLARLGAVDFRLDVVSVDVADVARQAARVWAARCAAADVELRVELPAGPTTAPADPTRLRQVLDGLAENALRATPGGRPLVFAVCRDGAEVVLEVRDGGPGLTDDDIRVAFERSALYDRYRGTRRVGTGVGLALAAGLVARMGGRVEAGHAAEGGARFAVRLPAEIEPPRRTA